MGIERVLALASGAPAGLGLRPAGLLWSLNLLVLVVLGTGGLVLAPLRRRRLLYGAAVAALSLFATVPVGRHVSAGPWISAQSWAWSVPWAVAATGALGMALFGWLCAPVPQPRWLTLALVGLSVGSGAADHFILPGQHTSFHLLLHGLAAMFLLTASTAMPWNRLPKGLAWTVAVGSAAAAFGSVINIAPPTRAELVHLSATGERMLGVGGPAAPESFVRYELEHLGERAVSVDAGAPQVAGLPIRGADGRPWNVLLVTIDTLRADALKPSRGPGKSFARPGDTPFLDGLADRSITFERAYAQASITHLSMPPMFRSTEAFEGDRVGHSLPMEMRELGLVPAAVVNNYFLEPRILAAQRMLDGFEYVEVYDFREMGRTVPLATAALDALQGQRFFLWVHFYQMHKPGYAGQVLTRRKHGSHRTRYRKSLKWLDGQMAKLMGELDRLGVAESTITLLMSDHGEALGANNRDSHGSTIYEEEIRVPLYFHVPGLPGRVVPDLVGNIDMLPTLLDLLGAPPNPLHRGRSLAALLMGAPDDRTPTYYLQSNRKKFSAVVRGSDKLILARKTGAYLRFDLQHDPTEDHNLYGSDPGADSAAVRRLLRTAPHLFSSELKDEQTLDLLRTRLAEADANTDPADLDLLLRLAVAAKLPALRNEAKRLFVGAADDASRLMIVRRVGRRDPELLVEVTRHLASLAGKPEERAFVEGLALQRQGTLKGVATRLRHWAEVGGPEDWRPWLKLIRPWKNKPAATFAPVLGSMLRRLGPESPELRLVLEALAGTTRQASAVAVVVRPWLEHTVPGVRALAIAALGSVGDDSDAPAIERALTRGSARERQAAVHTAARVLGSRAVPWLIEAKKDVRLTLDVVEGLKRIATPECLPPLQDVADNFYNPTIGKRAKKAIKAVRRKLRRKKPRAREQGPGGSTGP